MAEDGRLRALVRVGGRFLAVGGLSTAIEIAVFNGLVYLVGMDPIPAKIVASLVALINAYIGSRLWTFRERRSDSGLAQALRFLAVNAACAVLGATIVGITSSVLSYRLGLDGALWLNLANLFSIGVVIVVRFALYHLWVFPDRGTEPGVSPVAREEGRVARLLGSLRAVSPSTYLVGFVLGSAFVVSLWQSRYGGFVDEYDNLLGGWLLLYRGELPYTGFFSHHMPLAYFVAAPIVAVTGTNLVAFRLLFATLMFLWLLLIYRTVVRSSDRIAGVVLVLAMTAFQTGVLAHMLVAETLIAYAIVHAVALIGVDLAARRRVPTIRDTAVVAVLGAVPILSSLSYAPLSLIIYVWFGLVYLLNLRAAGVVRPRILLARAARVVGWLLVPYAVFGLYLVVTVSLGRFVEQAYVFNTNYYSQFVGDVSTGIIDTLGSNLSTFFHAFGMALQGGPTLESAFSLVLAVSFILAVLALVVMRRYLTAVFMALLIVFAGYRSEAPVGIFTNPSGRFMIYAGVAIAIGVAIVGLVRGDRTDRRPRGSRVIAVAALLVAAAVISTPALAGAKALLHFVRTDVAGAASTIQVNEAGGDVAVAANAVLDTHDRYFVGPFDFYTQLYLDGQRSSIYTFFLPWHGACEGCRVELTESLDRDRPRVILWDAEYQLWGMAAVDYAPEVQDRLDESYFRVADPRLENLYFLADERSTIIRELSEVGFDARVLAN